METTDGASTLRPHDKVYLHELENILTKMAIEMRDSDPAYSEIVDKHFWRLT